MLEPRVAGIPPPSMRVPVQEVQPTAPEWHMPPHRYGILVCLGWGGDMVGVEVGGGLDIKNIQSNHR